MKIFTHLTTIAITLALCACGSDTTSWNSNSVSLGFALGGFGSNKTTTFIYEGPDKAHTRRNKTLPHVGMLPIMGSYTLKYERHFELSDLYGITTGCEASILGGSRLSGLTMLFAGPHMKYKNVRPFVSLGVGVGFGDDSIFGYPGFITDLKNKTKVITDESQVHHNNAGLAFGLKLGTDIKLTNSIALTGQAKLLTSTPTFLSSNDTFTYAGFLSLDIGIMF